MSEAAAPAQEVVPPPNWQPTLNLRWCERSTAPQEQLRGAPPRITELQQLFVIAEPDPGNPMQMNVQAQQWRPVPAYREGVAPPQIAGPS